MLINFKRCYTLIPLAIVCCLGVASCVSQPPSITCETPQLTENQVSNKIKASIYIDATESMKGFVTEGIGGSQTRYARLLDGIIGSLQTEWTKPEIKYYPFGEIVDSEIHIDEYRKAKTVNFYSRGKNFEYSKIETAIGHSQAAPDNLTIIITDLYQKSGTTDDIVAALKNKYFNEQNTSYSVGIIAHRSEFEGRIYDVGHENRDFDYTTRNKSAEQYRPFYIIALGSPKNIEQFFQSLSTQPKAIEAEINSAKQDIISRQLVQEIAKLDINNAEIILPDKKAQGRILERPSGINSSVGTIRVDSSYTNSVDLLKITDLTSPKNIIKNRVNYSLLPAQYISISALEYIPKIEIFEPDEENQKASFKNVDNSQLRQSLKLENIKPNPQEQQLTFDTVINSSTLTPGIYKITIFLRAKELKSSDWWDKWNGTEEIVDQKEGFKTYNLLSLMDNIKLGILKSSDRTIGKLCYLIEKTN